MTLSKIFLPLRILLPGVTAFIVIILLFGFLTIQLNNSERQSLEFMKSEVLADGAELQHEVDRLFRRKEIELVRGSIAFSSTHPYSAYSALIDVEGRISEATRASWVGKMYHDVLPVESSVIAGFQSSQTSSIHVLENGIAFGLFPISMESAGENTKQGTLIYALNAMPRINEAKAEAWQWFRALAQITIIVVMVLGLAMNWLVSRRVDSLRMTVARVAEGDFGVRPIISCHDELTQLAQGMSMMIDRLESTSIDRDRSFLTLRLQNAVLSGIVEEKPLKLVMENLCKQVESLYDRSICFMMQLTDDNRLRIVAGPSLNEKAKLLIDGMVPGPSVGSCGTAAYRGTPVYVCDTQSDPLWSSFRGFASEFNIQSCWSYPIKDGNMIYGTIAVSHLVGRKPSTQDQETLEATANLALIAVRRDRVQRELRESEGHFRTLADSGPSMIWKTDEQGRLTYANKSWQEFTGLSSKDGLGEVDLAGIHRDDVSKIMEVRHRSMKLRQRYELNYRFRRHDGEFRWIHESGVPLWDESAIFLGFIGHCSDVTEQVSVQEKLKESESRLRMAVSAGQIGLWDWNINTNEIHFNQEWKEQMGFGESKKMDSIADFESIIHERDSEKIRSKIKSAVDNPREALESEFRIKLSDGGLRWVYARAEVFFDDQSLSNKMSGCLIDITARKEAESRLVENELRLRQMAENSDMVFWLTDISDNVVLYVSPAFEEVWGVRAEDLYEDSNRWTRSIHPEDVHRVEESFANIVSQKCDNFDTKYRVIQPNGSIRWIHDKGRLICDLDGTPYRIAGVARDITEQKQFEDALKDGEERFRVVVESVPTGLVAVNDEGVIELVNQRVLDWFGYSRDELLGNSVELLMPSRYQERHVMDRKMYMSDPNVRPMGSGRDLFALRKNGTEFPVEIGLVPIRSGGKQLALAAIADITERQLAEGALRQSEARYRTVVDKAMDPLFVCDLNRKFLDINQSACDKLGYTREELLLLSVEDVNAEFDAATFKVRIQEWLSSPGKMTAYETLHRRKDGSVFPVEMRVGVVSIGGQMTIVAIAHDLTRRKKIELEILALNSQLERRVAERTAELGRLAEILDASPDYISISVLDQNHFKNIYSNGAIRKLFESRGLDPNLIRYDLIHPENSVKRLLDEGLPFAMQHRNWLGETEVLGPGNQIIPVSQLVQAHESEDTKEVYISTVMRDISDRKLMENELRHRRDALMIANDELAKASRLKDEFLASMSHELRTPLNGVLAISEAMQEGVYGELNELQLPALKDIEQCGRHLLTLINDILDLSKVEAGQISLEIEPVDVDHLCQTAVRFVKEMAQKKKLKVSLSVDGEIGTLLADQRRLKQILVNLLSNAVKFTPERGSVSLDVTGDKHRQAIEFAISDTGIGIRKEDIALLFKPFQQIDSRLSREYSGTGLGLALVRRMAELHGGSVSVTSQPGLGSCFKVAIPWIEQANSCEDGIASCSSLIRKIVLIEDSQDDSLKIGRALSDLGVVSVTHRSYAGAINKIRVEKPELVMVDLLLPDGDGWALLKEIKNDLELKSLPVIVVSVVDDRSRCLSMGAADLLIKPIDRETLRTSLIRVAMPLVSTVDIEQTNVDKGLPGTRLLIAEDNPVNAKILKDYLVKSGFGVEVATNGLHAVERALESLPAMILIDIQMPGIDGLEAIAKIRSYESTRKIPIVAVTALAMPGDRERCLAAGANDYLMKPVSLKSLREIIEKLIPTAFK